MNTRKVMAIIGLVWGALSLFCIISFSVTDVEASMGWGMLALLYFIPFCIVMLCVKK